MRRAVTAAVPLMVEKAAILLVNCCGKRGKRQPAISKLARLEIPEVTMAAEREPPIKAAVEQPIFVFCKIAFTPA